MSTYADSAASSMPVASRRFATWDISSKLPSRPVHVAWGAFAVLNLIAMLLMVNVETIPFHFIWVSFTLVHGFWPWSRRAMSTILGGVCLSTSAVLFQPVTDGQLDLQEMAEVPLMAAMFLAMAWHAHRRQRAVEVAQLLAASEHEARERERDFVRDASHEIRSPITIARGHLELLLRAGLDPSQSEDATVAMAELDRLSHISDGLLMIARLEQPNGLYLAPLDLAETLAQSVRRWSAVAPRRWLLEVGTDVVVRADGERLGVALDALLENAVQHTQENSRITLRLRALGTEHVVLEVSDDGPGIALELRERIFERFYHRGHERNPNGSGLGLAIVQAIAVAHGGEVTLQTSLEGGAQFAIHLPVLGPPEAAELTAPV